MAQGVPGENIKLCHAKSKQTGNQCKNAAIPGGEVCRFHGGAAPQVVKSANARLAAMVDPALDALIEIVNSNQKPGVRLAAAKDILDRAGYGATRKVEVENVTATRTEKETELAEIVALRKAE